MSRDGGDGGGLAARRAALESRLAVVEALTEALALIAAGRLEEAGARARAALAAEPENPEGHHLAGLIELRAGRPAEAAAHLARAVALAPDHGDARLNLGLALKEGGRRAEAKAAFEGLLARRPDHAEATVNLGLLAHEEGDFEAAAAAFRGALRARPDDPDILTRLGVAEKDGGRLEAAIALQRRALALAPEHAAAHYNLALALLAAGRFAEGWREYEWRWAQPNLARVRRQFAAPAWDGSPLAGRTILLHAEQGLGDAIQFVRYARLVRRAGAARIVIECWPGLVRLLRGADGVDEVVPFGAPLPPFATHAPLMSLPHLCGTTVESVPAEVPYLRPEADMVSAWRERLGGRDGRLWVGIGWQGDPSYAADSRRSIPLRHFAPLARARRLRLISLQKGPARDQLRALPADARVEDFGPRLDTGGDGFVDTAALIASLDLVVTSDTALAHLAGATARPVWLLLADAPDWRWMREREDSPWYPTMRLFRQRRPGDWDEVIARVLAALAAPSPRPPG